MQVCPAFLKAEATTPAAAVSISASSNTMKGALPPSSSETLFTVSAAPAMSCLPTAVEPVKPILRTVFDSSSVSPAKYGFLKVSVALNLTLVGNGNQGICSLTPFSYRQVKLDTLVIQ